jgi:hypothetical protein
VIRALAVAGVFLVAAGMGLLSHASAQTSAKGQAVAILVLLGASSLGAPPSAKTPEPKSKSGLRAPHEAEGRIVDAKNGRKLDRPVELTDRTHGKHN